MESATAWTIRCFGSIVTIRTPSGSTPLSRRVVGLRSTHSMMPVSRPVGKTTERQAYAKTTTTLHLFSIRTGIIWKRYFVAIERTKIQTGILPHCGRAGFALDWPMRRYWDAWPDYDGNRMYRSLGNIVVRLDGKLVNNAGRLRINGQAEIDESAEAIAGLPGAKRLIRVTAEHIFTNCPRYIPMLSLEEPSVYVPREDTGHPIRPGNRCRS